METYKTQDCVRQGVPQRAQRMINWVKFYIILFSILEFIGAVIGSLSVDPKGILGFVLIVLSLVVIILEAVLCTKLCVFIINLLVRMGCRWFYCDDIKVKCIENVKPEIVYPSSVPTWTCRCGKKNPDYQCSCGCGMTKRENKILQAQKK